MLSIQGSFPLDSGGHRYCIDGAQDETRLDAASIRSIVYLFRFRRLTHSMHCGIPLQILLCLRKRPLLTLSVNNVGYSIHPHPVRFVTRR